MEHKMGIDLLACNLAGFYQLSGNNYVCKSHPRLLKNRVGVIAILTFPNRLILY